MNERTGSAFAHEYIADQAAGKYSGYAKCLEAGYKLGTDANAYRYFILQSEAAVFVSKTGKCDVNIRIQIKGMPDFMFRNNFLSIDPSSEKLLIEGDWVTEWGIIGSVDIKNKKLLIDIDPFKYSKTKSSDIMSDRLVNRYVIHEAGNTYQYKTVFNLEFVGMGV